MFILGVPGLSQEGRSTILIMRNSYRCWLFGRLTNLILIPCEKHRKLDFDANNVQLGALNWFQRYLNPIVKSSINFIVEIIALLNYLTFEKCWSFCKCKCCKCRAFYGIKLRIKGRLWWKLKKDSSKDLLHFVWIT